MCSGRERLTVFIDFVNVRLELQNTIHRIISGFNAVLFEASKVTDVHSWLLRADTPPDYMMILSPVTNEPVYLWNVPGKVVFGIPGHSQSCFALFGACFWQKWITSTCSRFSLNEHLWKHHRVTVSMYIRNVVYDTHPTVTRVCIYQWLFTCQ